MRLIKNRWYGWSIPSAHTNMHVYAYLDWKIMGKRPQHSRHRWNDSSRKVLIKCVCLHWISLIQYKSLMMSYQDPSVSIKAGNCMASYTVIMRRNLQHRNAKIWATGA
jgi:hypothetical protein